jgi:hypothetical protein
MSREGFFGTDSVLIVLPRLHAHGATNDWQYCQIRPSDLTGKE